MSKPTAHHNIEYGNESISALKGADRVRKRPGVIFGSDGIDGCQHAVFEILSNSIDEARAGFGKEIIVTRFEDNTFEVEDFGRGCPVAWNEKEQRYNWELVFCELYAGGKYHNATDRNYEFSLGLNGLGSCATQYSSEFMDVTIYRDGKKYTLRFEKGEIVGEPGKELQEEPYTGRRTGSIIRWKPDTEVFSDINIPAEFFKDTMKRQAVVNAGVKFTFKNHAPDVHNIADSDNHVIAGASVQETLDPQSPKSARNKPETTHYLYENGILDYIRELAGEETLTAPVFFEGERRGRDKPEAPEYKIKLEAAFCFSNQVSVTEYYQNSSWLEYGGSPDKAVRNAFVAEIDSYLKKTNKYKGNESKLTYQDVQDSLVLVTNSFAATTSGFENQTKKAFNNKAVQDAITEFLKERLEIYFIENKPEAEKIAEQVLINKRSRETAEKARLNLKKKLSGGQDITSRVSKFVDCRTKDVDKREIYIVEGDSALGACKLGRDAEFQGIIPVRGKILNCLKSDYGKIFASEIITDIIKVLGCGVEIQNKHSKDLSAFALDALRWNRVIICTDADVDGFHIRTQILAMLYRLVPTLIEKGYVYIAESPLFEITCKNKTYFAYNEREKNEIVESLGNAKYTLARSKGLGENEPEMMWLTTMNPDTRRLIQITPSEAEATADMFDRLLGDNLAGRKDYIAEHGHKYLDVADIQ